MHTQAAAARADEQAKVAKGAHSRRFLAEHLPAAIVERFRVMTNTKAFRELDANNDGVVTRQELRDACRRWQLPDARFSHIVLHCVTTGVSHNANSHWSPCAASNYLCSHRMSYRIASTHTHHHRTRSSA